MRSIAASAPGRAGIIGNPSDIYGGFVVSCSVEARATCRLTFGHPESLPEDRRLWDAAIARFPVDPVQVNWQTDIPRSSGLSGSTALLTATLACLLAARREQRALDDSIGFAEIVRDIERHEAHIMCGYQDAVMTVLGGLQAMDFDGKHPVTPGPRPTATALQADLPFLLITTGVERLSGAVHGPMSERWMNGEPAVVDGMARIADLGRQGSKAIQAENWPLLATLMTDNHAIVRSLGGSGEPIDALIDACLDSGADAAKLAGAGLGGTVIALTQAPDDLKRRLQAKGYSRFLGLGIEPGVRLEKEDSDEIQNHRLY